MRRRLAYLSTWGLVCWSSWGAAQCPQEGREYVRLTFTEPASEGCAFSSAELVHRVERYVRADLAAQNVDVCGALSRSATPPLATVDVQGDCALHGQVTIQLNDSVTQKELSRQVVLAGLPRDSHALAIAVGAVELLRASWAETRLQGASAAQAKHPVAVEKLVGESPPGHRERYSLGLLGASEFFTHGLTQFGVDAEFAATLFSRFTLFSRLGGRRALSQQARDGSIDVSGWLLGMGARWSLLRPVSSVEIRVLGHVDAMRLGFASIANAGGIATPQSTYALWSNGGFSGSVRVAEHAWLDTELSGGWVLTPVVATDNGKAVMGVRGGNLTARVGLSMCF